METDAAVLAKEASNFDRISGELQGVMGQIDATAGALAPSWQGTAGRAAQDAFIRYQEAANRQRQELADISSNIHNSGIQYTSTDEAEASSVQQVAGSMGL